MEKMKGKQGFTLIELLAVIVVLAIVMVLAATTVLPYMATARKQAFAVEANTAKDAASQAVSLITLGTVTSNYTKTTNGYCFTLENLKALGLFEKDDTNYKGIVEVTQSGNAYTYKVQMKNDQYSVVKDSGDVVDTDVKGASENTVAEACTAGS